MKQFNALKALLVTGMLGAASVSQAQNISHPLAYGPYTLIGGTATTSNWFKDYVGLRVEVTAPTVIAGSYTFTTANDGSGTTGQWGGIVTAPLVNVPIFMDPTTDSSGCSAFSPADVDSIANVPAGSPHKIFVIWRGPLSGPCDFGCKALHAQEAGASAVVIINEYPGQPPVGMGASTTCTGITIPVFMVGNLDGIAISGQYRSGAHVTMTITPWGEGLSDDLGIIPGGGATAADYARPRTAYTSNAALNMLDGGFIANFGTNPESDIKLSASLNFYPTGSSTPTFIHSDSVVFTSGPTDSVRYHSSILSTSARGATYPFNPADSILALFAASEYSIPTPATTGRYDLTYTLGSPDEIDMNTADNSATYSFYATDSLYSKGRYDFVNNKPIFGTSEQFGSGAEFIWGPMYFTGPSTGTAVEKIQYSLAQNSTSTPPTTVFLTSDVNGNFVFIYKWVDGMVGTADSIVEDGELQLVSASIYNFGANDTSDALLELNRYTTNNFIGGVDGSSTPAVYLDPSSWYYVAVDVPGSTFLGVDGQANPFPLVYGRAHQSNVMNYNNIVHSDTIFQSSTNPGQTNPPLGGAQANTTIDVDSFQFHSFKGVVPAVAMLVNRTPDTVNHHTGVKNVTKSSINMSVYPNPAIDYINVSVALQQPAKSVTYEIVDGLGRFVSKVTHYNVQNEVYNIPTTTLPAGHYHIAVAANGQLQVKPFVIIK